ncbi:YwaF family protein [Brachybacterium sp. DNPG3]
MEGDRIGHMESYGLVHLSMLVLIALAAIVLLRWSRRGDPAGVDRVLRIVGWALLANSALWTLWGFAPWAWDIDESLPLHYSDALRFLVPIALITRSRWSTTLVHYWGLTLNMMSVLTPDLNYFVLPPLEFAEYWIAHGGALLAAIVLTWGRGFRPTWGAFGLAYAATLLWSAVAMIGNLLTGANYGYLNHAPDGPSLLDVMGPWPVYLLVEMVAVAVVWALMTLPWTLRRPPAPLAPAAPLMPGARPRPGAGDRRPR